MDNRNENAQKHFRIKEFISHKMMNKFIDQLYKVISCLSHTYQHSL